MTIKKLALITALLIGSISAAVAAPHSYENTNSQQGIQFERAVDVGENGGGGGS